MAEYKADLVLIQEINIGAVNYYRALIEAYGDEAKTKSAPCASGVNKTKIDEKFAASIVGPLKEDHNGDWNEFKKHLIQGLEMIENEGKAEGKTEVILIEGIDEKELAQLNLQTAKERVAGYMDPFDNTFGLYSVYLKEASN